MEDMIILRYAAMIYVLADRLYISHVFTIPRLVSYFSFPLVLDANPITVSNGISRKVSQLSPNLSVLLFR